VTIAGAVTVLTGTHRAAKQRVSDSGNKSKTRDFV